MLLAMLPMTLASTFLLFAVIVVLIIIDPFLGSVASLVVPLLLFTVFRFAKRVIRLSFAVQERHAELSHIVEEAVTGIQVVKAYGQEPNEQIRLDIAALAIYRDSFGLAKHRAVFGPLFEAIPSLASVAVLWIGGVRVIQGSITPGDFVVFTLYLAAVIVPLRITAWFFAQLPRAAAAPEAGGSSGYSRRVRWR